MPPEKPTGSTRSRPEYGISLNSSSALTLPRRSMPGLCWRRSWRKCILGALLPAPSTSLSSFSWESCALRLSNCCWWIHSLWGQWHPDFPGSWIQARCIVVECLLQVHFHFYVEPALYHFVPWLDWVILAACRLTDSREDCLFIPLVLVYLLLDLKCSGGRIGCPQVLVRGSSSSDD